MLVSLLAAITIGLFSAFHCVGMCGGIIGTLTISLPAPATRRRATLYAYLAAYNVGRLGSYALAGALLSSLGSGLYAVVSPAHAHQVLQTAAGTLLACIGLYLAGWFPRFATIERLGVPLWRRIEPYGRKLLPVRSLRQALLYGLVWGWLPCGLVYSALLLTITMPTPWHGALFMAAFGIGTLPAVLGIGMLTDRLRRLARRPGLRVLAGLFLILLGLAWMIVGDALHLWSPWATQQQPLQCIDERF